MNAAHKIPCIEVRDVSFSYHGMPVLEDITFSIMEGEYVGIIGPNGGGKTTLIKIILGLLQPDSGKVLLYGEDLRTFRDRHLIGYVPQRSADAFSYFPTTVLEVVKSGNIKKNAESSLSEIMELTGISEYQHLLLRNLSGGQKQRVFIARALAGKPKILILDEPYAGMDTPSQENFYDFIERLHKDLGLTILFVSHDIEMVAQTVTTCLCVNCRLLCHGSAKEVLKGDVLEELYGQKLKLYHHRH